MVPSGLLRWWGWLKVFKNNALILYFAWKHPRTPIVVKVMLLALIAYIISPVDILPDYLPLFGFADDAVLAPAAMFYLINLLPETVRTECQRESERWKRRAPLILGLIVLFVVAWVALIIIGVKYLWVYLSR
ncbi:YkvA family protein [Sporolituus thermophilus]|uniref:Uncharacterized membrane protein YkvA, DUF1232 family n=1 Tax=Sporolituus thermophilus DSM 23256 TaxID=1123285 RepID=A0A1G7K940_9FIRM|nr:YkvA family protein [Sporolituus thermophilus]SDF33541.1 Uncharacterized membrane protein YkvA, DUF1232 family [Sporolituus thermophilus DSM 23256]